MGYYSYNDWDDRMEPGYDPGPEPDCQCEECGEIVFERELREDGCIHCNEEDDEPRDWEDPQDHLIDGVGFADPGGRSALRAATASNPRNLPCPNCGAPNRLTPADRARGYQCDTCADRAERGGF
jgi:hypothetical protein